MISDNTNPDLGGVTYILSKGLNTSTLKERVRTMKEKFSPGTAPSPGMLSWHGPALAWHALIRPLGPLLLRIGGVDHTTISRIRRLLHSKNGCGGGGQTYRI